MEEADTGYLKSGVLPSWERLDKQQGASDGRAVRAGRRETRRGRLTRAVRSCSGSGPARSPPSSSRSGSGAAPVQRTVTDMTIARRTDKPGESGNHAHLLVVRVLDQLLGVIQFSYQGILGRNRKKLTRWRRDQDVRCHSKPPQPHQTRSPSSPCPPERTSSL